MPFYHSERMKARSCGSFTSFSGETHHDSGVVHVKSEDWSLESITTPLTMHSKERKQTSKTIQREMARVFNKKNKFYEIVAKSRLQRISV